MATSKPEFSGITSESQNEATKSLGGENSPKTTDDCGTSAQPQDESSQEQNKSKDEERKSEDQPVQIEGNKYTMIVSGKTLNAHMEIKRKLHKQIPALKEVSRQEKFDFILVFCPVVSRAGTDIEAALCELNCVSDSKPAVLVVLHNTFNPEQIVSDSSRSVGRKNTITVDCLFYEDTGLLQCQRNDIALTRIINHIKPQKKTTESQTELFKRLKERSSPKTTDDCGTCAQPQEQNEKSKDEERKVSGETRHSAAPFIRKSSMQGLPPKMGVESSHPDSPVLVPVSELSIRLVLLGRTRSGKSAAGNIILGREERIQAGTSTETKSEIRQGEVAGMQVTVVDTPDWFCPDLSLEEVRQDVELCVRLSAPGPHAFLLVIPVKQHAGEVKGMLEKMEEIFGERCWKNTMILFTVIDEQQKENVFTLSGNQEISKLVKKCGERYQCLNIKEREDSSQVSELLGRIVKIVKENEFYSSEIYQEIREMEKRIIKVYLEVKENEIQSDHINIQELSEKIRQLEQAKSENNKQIIEVNMDLLKKIKLEHETNKMLLNTMRGQLKQDIVQMREVYDGQGWGEHQQLMKILLPELHHMLWVSRMQLKNDVELGGPTEGSVTESSVMKGRQLDTEEPGHYRADGDQLSHPRV